MDVAAKTIVIQFVYPSQYTNRGIRANDGRFCIRSKTGIKKSPTLLLLTKTATKVATMSEMRYATTNLNKERAKLVTNRLASLLVYNIIPEIAMRMMNNIRP